MSGYLEKYSDEELFQIFDANIEDEIKSRGYEYGWHKKVQYAGDIYIFVNPAFPNLVKIGYSDNFEKRLKQLNSNSGLPDPFHVYATYKVKKRLEDLKLHKLIDFLDASLKHVPNKEFYDMSPEKAYAILSAIAEINGDEDLLVLNPLNDDFFTDVNDSDTHDEDGIVPDGTYHMCRKVKRWNNREVEATAIVRNGKWIVQPGSVICPVYGKGDKTVAHIQNVRKSVRIEDNILKEEVTFDAPSTAAGFAIGGPVNGWAYWMTEDGVLIEEFKNKRKE